MLLKIVIFTSGGAILALELLASRIMTPYFGVSLYIWTGILSITLIALALGYWAGGKLAAATSERLNELYALMPAVAGIAIVAACLAYPFLFAPLANWSLVYGSFVACLALLFVPLVAASAMNPLLVAILHGDGQTKSGDGGAGNVFFISTLGSVAGVLMTAFGLIPHMSNYTATLIVAIVLSALTLAIAVSAPALKRRNVLLMTSVAGIAAAAVLLWQADAYTGRLGPVSYAGKTWRVEATERSLFGTVKILKHDPDPDGGHFWRIYFQDGLTQNSVESSGHSRSFYTYALEALARAYRPDMKNALVLGLGAGMVPRALAARGVNVEVVEIDTSSVRIATRLFGLDAQKIKIHETDARTFLRASERTCARRYDVVVVDLFHGDGTPDYLVTREFFRDLKGCLATDGLAVFNTFADLDRPSSYAHLLVTLRGELPHLALYRPQVFSPHINSFIVAGAKPLPAAAKVVMDYVPPQHETMLWDMLAKPTELTANLFAGGKLISDAWNPAAFELATAQMVYRRSVVEGMPPAFLLN